MDRIITITGCNVAKKTLELSDKGTTNADPGDQVTWVIAPGSGVAAITAIIDYKTTPDVFSPDPKLVSGTTNWEGTIKSDIPFGTEEDYSITWTAVGGGWHGQNLGGIVTDPKIKINLGHR